MAKRPHPGAVPTQQNKSKDEIELKTSSLVPTNYKTYHIFNGSFKLNGEDNVAKNFNNINLLTFDTDSNVTKVTEIPSVILKTTITAQGLNEYLRGRVFKQNKEKKGTYLIHQGWLESNASTTAMKNLLIK